MSSDLQQRRSDETEPKKPSRQIHEHELVEGTDALKRLISVLFISAISAGLDIGFSLLQLCNPRKTTWLNWSCPFIRAGGKGA